MKISDLKQEKRERFFAALEFEKGKDNNFAVEYYKLYEEKGETIANEYLERLYDTFMDIVNRYYTGDKLEDGSNSAPKKMLDSSKSASKFKDVEEGDYTIISDD